MNIEQYIKDFTKWWKSRTTTKEDCIKLLEDIGIYDNGKLSKNYE